MTGRPVISGDEDDEALLTLRRQRRVTRAHGVLWAVILATTAADMVLTMAGTAAGLQEGNVVVRTAMATLGPAGLWLVKFGAMCWLVAGWALLSDRNATVFLALFAVVTGAVVVHNALVVFG